MLLECFKVGKAGDGHGLPTKIQGVWRLGFLSEQDEVEVAAIERGHELHQADGPVVGDLRKSGCATGSASSFRFAEEDTEGKERAGSYVSAQR